MKELRHRFCEIGWRIAHDGAVGCRKVQHTPNTGAFRKNEGILISPKKRHPVQQLAAKGKPSGISDERQ
jgi:hypothetical protein